MSTRAAIGAATDAQRLRALEDLLLQIEVNAHRRGWDDDPQLLVVYDTTDAATTTEYDESLPPDGGLTRRGRLAARRMWPSELLNPTPAHAVFTMAVGLHYDSQSAHWKVIRDVLRQPGFFAVALVFEMWVRRPDMPFVAPGSFAKAPDSVEVREVLAVLPDGSSRGVLRMRDRSPGPFTSMSGSVSESLHVIAAHIAGMPLPTLTTPPAGWARSRIEHPGHLVVLDRITDESTLPDYCVHGRATCVACGHWCWVGSKTHDVITGGDAKPVCMECAQEYYDPGTRLGHVDDHRRADGPHA